MKKTFFLLTVLLLLVTACTAPAAVPQVGACGDGICDGPENSSNCPADCTAAQPAVNAPPQMGTTDQPVVAQPSTGNATGEQPVLMIGFMVHLEGWDDASDENSFNGHVAKVREYASLFETYGAKITFESKELTDGAIRWGDNVLLEMQQRGHGVGVHADEGGGREPCECDGFTEALIEKKQALESLGVSVLHVSGVVSVCDWVTATADAGFEFVTGTVAYGAMSLSPDLIPAEYADCPNPGSCHQVFPTELADRIHPWRADDGSNWILNDPDGQLVILSASQGLTCMEEETSANSTRDCVFNPADIEAYIEQLELALSLAEPGQVNVFYVGNSLGAPLDMDLLEAWLQAIQPYVVSGQVVWATLPEMYQAYTSWEASQ